MALSDLKPCPFCGEAPTSYPSGDGSGTMIECMSRDCVGPHVSYYGKGVAERVWNTRAPDERVKGLVEALTALLALFDDYRDSDLSHSDAHNILVRYPVWGAAREALSAYQDKPSE